MKRALLPLLAALCLASCGAPTPNGSQGAPASGAPAAANAPSQDASGPPDALVAEPISVVPPTAGPPTPPPTAGPPTPPPTAGPPTPPPTPGRGGRTGTILFLRGGNLWAFDVASRQERQLADHVSDVAATPDGSRIAMVRREGNQTDLWSIRRDGSNLTRLTNDTAIEASPSWSAAGNALAFAAAQAPQPNEPDWFSWAAWCVGSEVRVLELPSGQTRTLAAGCEPAIAPNGTRIAFATPPTERSLSAPTDRLLAHNSIRIVNRQGQNGWNFARADGGAAPAPNHGELVYAPSWSPDGQQLTYHRFIGYRALVDLNTTEIGQSYRGRGELLNAGAGWLLPVRFAPVGRLVAITQHNYSDPRGGQGYTLWMDTLLVLEGSREISLPDGPTRAVGQEVRRQPYGQRVAWASDGVTLAVQLPPNWPTEPGEDGARGQPGEVWRWQAGGEPGQRLFSGVDPASPLVWLP